jgi:hypothetical protein
MLAGVQADFGSAVLAYYPPVAMFLSRTVALAKEVPTMEDERYRWPQIAVMP